MEQFILLSIGVFLLIILLLVIVLLVAKKYLSPSGNVTITINGDKQLSVEQGNSLMSTLNENGIFLPSACGGKASCGQCKVQVLSGGGEILDSERPHFTRKQIKEHWRLGCQCKVKGNLDIRVPDSVMGVKEWECTVISNKNVSSFIKEFKVALPPGEHMDFVPGSYAQIKIPAYDCIDYNVDFDKNDIGEDYIKAWEKFNIFSLKAHNPVPTVRAYSMANYPAEGDIITLTVRIATTPFLPRPQVGFQLQSFVFVDFQLAGKGSRNFLQPKLYRIGFLVLPFPEIVRGFGNCEGRNTEQIRQDQSESQRGNGCHKNGYDHRRSPHFLYSMGFVYRNMRSPVIIMANPQTASTSLPATVCMSALYQS